MPSKITLSAALTKSILFFFCVISYPPSNKYTLPWITTISRCHSKDTTYLAFRSKQRIAKVASNSFLLLQPTSKAQSALIDRVINNFRYLTQRFESIGVLVPQDHQGGATSASVDYTVKDLLVLPPVIPQYPVAPSQPNINSNKDLKTSTLIILQHTPTPTPIDSRPKADALGWLAAVSGDRMNIFLRNVVAPSLNVLLSSPGVRLETILQLAYCNQLLRIHLPSRLAVASITTSLDPSQQASVDALLRDKEEQNKVRELVIKFEEEFMMDGLKGSEEIAEVVILGPYLDQEQYRKLLNCFISEFEAVKLLDIDLLQGLVQLVRCAETDYFLPDDLIHILAVLRTRLQDTHRQTTKHPYNLTLALSRLLDVMFEGKVQDLNRVVDHEPLSALLGQMMGSADPYVKHQATYALQGLLHVPNDETRRQFVLRHAGNIVMSLLGVVSVCSFDFGGLSDGAGKLRDATVSALEIGGKVVDGPQSIYESGQGIFCKRQGRHHLWWKAALVRRFARGSGAYPQRSAVRFQSICLWSTLQYRSRVPMGGLLAPWRDFH
ncbi:MAG: hypothetical protein J3R72DRAFT_481016 [Linnemannia gamsii]|nr:MAG: hypothetical protein J3R72DRAFT_481016 [Linnemannia gamsii]